MASAPIDGIGGATSATTNTQGSQSATDAFGLGFEDLLKIVLTQLTYQDPLKPMDNFQFVSQLAQFSQIQQTQTMTDRLTSILQAEGAVQATSVLGRTVDIPAGDTVITGKVKAITFERGEPKLTIETADDRTISSISLSTVTRIATEN